MSQSPSEPEQSMIRNLESKSGQSLEEWIGVVQDSGLTKHTEIIKYLKSEHDFTHGYANLVSLKARAAAQPSPAGGEDLVANQYSGAKESLRPIYDALAKTVAGFGTDVELAPKKSYVSLRRNKQFGIIQPSTKTRVDVGINLKGVAPDGRLEASGSFNSMVSHRVRLSSTSDVDDQLAGWLRSAYEEA